MSINILRLWRRNTLKALANLEKVKVLSVKIGQTAGTILPIPS